MRNRYVVPAALVLIAVLVALALLLSPHAFLEDALLPAEPAITTWGISEFVGEPLEWKEVNLLFPRFAAAWIIDVRTGRRFEVQRRAGSYHADIQPVSATDTQVLKELYGKWSWRRRAVVLEIGMQRIAGSINGMPHGQGRIESNDFPGHFCIHFLNSRVHASNKVDTAHQMMVWKAAGQPEKPFLDATPEKTVELVLAAFNQNDGALASQGLTYADADMWLLTADVLGILPAMDIQGISLQKDSSTEEGLRLYQLSLSLTYPDKRVVLKSGEIGLLQDEASGRWRLDGYGLKKLLEQE